MFLCDEALRDVQFIQRCYWQQNLLTRDLTGRRKKFGKTWFVCNSENDTLEILTCESSENNEIKIKIFYKEQIRSCSEAVSELFL